MAARGVARTCRRSFLLCRDDRFFPAEFQRRVVRERLGITPDEMERRSPARARAPEGASSSDCWLTDASNAVGGVILDWTGLVSIPWRNAGSDMSGATASIDAHAAPLAVRLTGIRKRFGDVVAADGVDLEIAEGEFFTMLGPSGSGKTTLLRMIAGFERPDDGTVELAGRRRDAPSRRTCATSTPCSRTTRCSRT